MRDRRAAEKGAEESCQTDDSRFSPFGFEDGWIELRAGKKCQNDGPCSRQKRDPLRVAGQAFLRQEDADDQLGHRAHHNLRERRGDLEPDRQ